MQQMNCYDEALKDWNKVMERINELKPHALFVESLKEVFPHLNLSTTLGYQNGSLQGALLHVNDLDDIRDAVPVCKAVIAAGYKPKGFSDYPEIKRRTYDYGDVQVSAFLKWDGSSKCEWKQIGTEPKPVYQLICKEGEPIENTTLEESCPK